jgi:hypothetical protein
MAELDAHVVYVFTSISMSYLSIADSILCASGWKKKQAYSCIVTCHGRVSGCHPIINHVT